MNTAMRWVATAVLMGVATAATAGWASAELKVPYKESELASPQLAAGLHQRLATAVRNHCAPLDGRALENKLAYRRCVHTLLTRAVQQLNSPVLTSVHEAHMGQPVVVAATQLAGTPAR